MYKWSTQRFGRNPACPSLNHSTSSSFSILQNVFPTVITSVVPLLIPSRSFPLSRHGLPLLLLRTSWMCVRFANPIIGNYPQFPRPAAHIYASVSYFLHCLPPYSQEWRCLSFACIIYSMFMADDTFPLHRLTSSSRYSQGI